MTKGEDVEFTPQRITTPWELPDRHLTWPELVEYITKHRKEKHTRRTQRCYTKIKVNDIEFTAMLTPQDIATPDKIFVRTETELKKHRYFTDCMTAIKLCEQLICFNVTDTSDSLITDHPPIAEYNSLTAKTRIYDCHNGSLYVETTEIGLNLTQAIFVDNELIRKNLHVTRLIRPEFIGVIYYQKGMYTSSPNRF